MEGTKNYAWPITAISKENYNVIVSCIRENKKLFSLKKILIFGAGIRGTEISVILESIGYTNIVFTDNNQDKWGGTIDNYPIVSIKEALNLKNEAVFFVSVEEGEPICKQLEAYGLKKNKDYFFPRPDLYGRFIKEFKRDMHDKVLVMGDCMFEVISFDEENKDSLTEIIQQRLGNEDVKLMTMHGMGLPSFYHILKAQLNCGMVPSIFVVMLNFETLTGKQHLLPRSQHTELIHEIYNNSPDPDGELLHYVKMTEERVKNIQAEFFTTNKFSTKVQENNSKGIISDRASKVFFKLNYMYKLDPTIESIQCLINIMKMAKDNGFVVLPFVPPVNYERGIELFGEEFEKTYRENYKILERVVKAENFKLLDLSHICTKQQFAHITTPDETTNYEGRVKIATCICNEIERIRERYTGDINDIKKSC